MYNIYNYLFNFQGKKGFKNLTGIDYAKEAIQLAEHVAKLNQTNLKLKVLL